MVVSKRKSLSKKTRFEVFKRDSFACVYCGNKAPDNVLHVDHIVPVSKGGTNDLLNLATACQSCNGGKGPRELSDASVVEKQRAQLDELQIRREQIQMMLDWQRGLMGIDDEAVSGAAELWGNIAAGYSLTDTGTTNLRGWIKKFGLQEVIEAMRVSSDTYLKMDDDGKYTSESVGKAFHYVPRICVNKGKWKEKPHLKDLYYIRGILRNRLNYVNDHMAIKLLEDAYNNDVAIDELKELSLTVKNWTEFREAVEAYLEEPSP